ncbi:MAG: hypothetical protein ACR2PH_00100 [Desulfobulbia bacterium]
MSTKKVYVEMVAFLEAHKDSKIADVLKSEAFIDIIEAKKNTQCVLKNDKGEITHIFCYYHKQWEKLADVEYGKKASHPTGFNTMCKIGVNKWTKQYNDSKKAKAELLDLVATGELDPKDIPTRIEEIDAARNAVDMSDAPKGMKEMPKQ